MRKIIGKENITELNFLAKLECGHKKVVDIEHIDYTLCGCRDCYNLGDNHEGIIYVSKRGNVDKGSCHLCKEIDLYKNMRPCLSSNGKYYISHQKCIDLNNGFATKKENIDCKITKNLDVNNCDTINSISKKSNIKNDNKCDLVNGIYKITNIKNGKIYIGESKNIHNRWKSHINNLNKNKHHSHKLQNDWNIYGEDSFYFEVIQENKKYTAIERIILEDIYMNKFKSIINGYNIENTIQEYIAKNKGFTCSSNETKLTYRMLLVQYLKLKQFMTLDELIKFYENVNRLICYNK